MGELLKKGWYDHTMKYYIAVKMNEPLILKTTWINFKTITLSERHLTQTHCIIPFYYMIFSKYNTIGKRKQFKDC